MDGLRNGWDRRCGSGWAAAALDDEAAGEVGGDKAVSGGGAFELEGEVVHLIEEVENFAGFCLEICGEDGALRNRISWCRDASMIVVTFLF